MRSPPGDASGGGDRTRTFPYGGGKYTRWPRGRQLFTMWNAAGRAAERCRAASGGEHGTVERRQRHAHARLLESLARDPVLAVATGHFGPRAYRLGELVPSTRAPEQEPRRLEMAGG